MVLCNKFFIILIKASFLHIILAQKDIYYELRATPNNTGCRDPNDFPLFGPNSCISRAAYTAIFLISIILAGISFLLLIGLSILFCLRRSKSSSLTDSDKKTSDRSSSSSISSDSVVEIPPKPRKNQPVSTTAIEDRTKKDVHQSSTNYYDVSYTRESSAPYTVVKPVAKQPIQAKVTTVIHKQTDVHEMTSQRPVKPSRNQPANPRQINRNQKHRYNSDSSNEGNISSQF